MALTGQVGARRTWTPNNQLPVTMAQAHGPAPPLSRPSSSTPSSPWFLFSPSLASARPVFAPPLKQGRPNRAAPDISEPIQHLWLGSSTPPFGPFHAPRPTHSPGLPSGAPPQPRAQGILGPRA